MQTQRENKARSALYYPNTSITLPSFVNGRYIFFLLVLIKSRQQALKIKCMNEECAIKCKDEKQFHPRHNAFHRASVSQAELINTLLRPIEGHIGNKVAATTFIFRFFLFDFKFLV